MDLHKVIKAHGYNSVSLAKLLTDKDGNKGVSQTAAYNILNRNPTLEKLKEVASILGISVTQLIAEAEDVPFSSPLVCPHCGKPLAVKIE